MVNEQTLEVFNSWIEEYSCFGNDEDEYWGEIPSDVKRDARRNFEINVEEDILMVRDTSFWNNRDQGLVITDWGLHCINDNEYSDSAFSRAWADIDHVEYKDEVFYFYGKTELECQIPIGFFFKDEGDYCFSDELCELFGNMANSQEKVDAAAILNQYDEEIEGGTFSTEELEKKGKELIDSDIFSDYGIALVLSYMAKAWCKECVKVRTHKGSYAKLTDQEELKASKAAADKIIEYANQALNTIPEEDLGDIVAKATFYKSFALKEKGDDLTAVRIAIDAMGKSTDDGWTEKLKFHISGKGDNGQLDPERGYGISGDTFSHRPYQERQFIFIVKDLDSIGGCYDEADNIKYVFPLDELPGDITFPFGHPQPNTLYYAHPLRPYYLPAEGANLTLFYEKIQEIGRMLQCLGATSITLRCLKGKQISEQVDQMLNAEGEAGNRLVSVNGAMSDGLKRGMQHNSRNLMEETKHYNPTRFPYCPPDLLWAALDPQLNHLVKERLEGGLLHFSKKVSSHETMNVTTNRMRDIKGTFDHFMAKLSAHYNAQEDRTFSETEETEWEITAEFKPLCEFGNQADERIVVDAEIIAPKELPSAVGLTAEEEEYVEMVQEVLADGEITGRERKLLEKLRVKLGISEGRATELEASLAAPKLSEEEQEYLDEYREIIADGEITPRERKLLDKICRMNGITAERAKEIEALA